jgi:hypothetical protein
MALAAVERNFIGMILVFPAIGRFRDDFLRRYHAANSFQVFDFPTTLRHP